MSTGRPPGGAASEPWSWPALALGDTRPPEALECERAIWGKAHGVLTDYRWLARSRGFSIDQRPELELNVGLEDRPTRAFFWRVTHRVWAVAGCRSRAVDAAGRSGFFEKQVLEWCSPAGPRALGALLLLECVSSFDDGPWWSRRDDEVWADADFVLELTGEELPRLTVDAADLSRRIAGGCSALRNSVSERALAAFYTRLLAGSGPALLARDEPLPAGALAALLLPLPRQLADRLSLAGWYPSRRAKAPQELTPRWQGLVMPGTSGTEVEPSELGRAMARAIFSGDPAGLPAGLPSAPTRRARAAAKARSEPPAPVAEAEEPKGPVDQPAPAFPPGWPRRELALTPPAADSSPAIDFLYRFAASIQRRWLDPQDLVSCLGGQLTALDAPGEQRLLTRWIEEVKARRPATAHPEQWEVKVDLLRAAALALIPEPRIRAGVGLPTTGRVPALAYAVHLRPADFAALRQACGREAWDRLVNHSVEGCPRVARWSAQIGEWLSAQGSRLLRG